MQDDASFLSMSLELKRHVPNVMLSLGGAAMNPCWGACMQKGAMAVAQQVVAFTSIAGLDGVDIDYEDDRMDGDVVNFLVELSKNIIVLMQESGVSKPVLAHAPIAHHLHACDESEENTVCHQTSYSDVLTRLDPDFLSFVVVQYYK